MSFYAVPAEPNSAEYPSTEGCPLYITSKTAFGTFIKRLNDPNVAGAFIQIMTSPIDNIFSVRAYPFDVFKVLYNENTTLAPEATVIKINNYSVGSFASGVLNITYNRPDLVFLGKFTISGSTSSFLDYSPNTSYTLYLPFFNTIQLSANDLLNATELQLYMACDLVSGNATVYAVLYYSATQYATIAQRTCKIGHDVPVVEKDFNLLSAAVQTIPSAIIGGGKSIDPSVIINGLEQTNSAKLSIGDSTALYDPRAIYLIKRSKNVTYPTYYNSHYGRPSSYSGALSGLTGYTKCASVHVEGIPTATKVELDMIEQQLKDGVIL